MATSDKHARLNSKPNSNCPQNLMKKSIPKIIICSCPWCPKRECGRRRSNTVTNVAKSRFLESRKNHHLFLLLIILRHIFLKYDMVGVILRSAKTQKNAHFCPLYKCQGELILKNFQKLPMDTQGFPCVTLTKRYDLVWDSGGAV